MTNVICPQRQARSSRRPHSSGFTPPYRTRKTIHFQRFWQAWIKDHAPWQPAKYFSYYKVTGPKKLKPGSYASIALQLFFVSITDHKEYCLSPPFRCQIEILSQKPIPSTSGQNKLSIEAVITHFQDKALFIKLPEEQPNINNCSLIMPKDLYNRFHMIYDPKARTDQTYRGVIDYWITNKYQIMQYNPPKYHCAINHLHTPDNLLISYLIDPIDSSDASPGEDTVLVVTRQLYTVSGKPVQHESFLLPIKILEYNIPCLEPQAVAAQEMKRPLSPDDTATDSKYLRGPGGSKILRESYLDFLDNFKIISQTLSPINDNPSNQLVHIAGIIQNTSPEKATEFSPKIFQPAMQDSFSLSQESDLFRPGNIISINSRRYLEPDLTKQPSPHAYIDRITGRNLPETGVFPYYPQVNK